MMPDRIRWHRLAACSFKVHALLEERATQTRRLVRPSPSVHDSPYGRGIVFPACPYRVEDGIAWCEALIREAPDPRRPFWAGPRVTFYRADGAFVRPLKQPLALPLAATVPWRWKRSVLPARFCPNSAVRRFGEIVQVKSPQRIQDIDDFSILEEGIQVSTAIAERIIETAKEGDESEALAEAILDEGRDERDQFRALWERLHGRGAWERNDWVWPIRFEPRDRAWGEARGFGRSKQ